MWLLVQIALQGPSHFIKQFVVSTISNIHLERLDTLQMWWMALKLSYSRVPNGLFPRNQFIFEKTHQDFQSTASATPPRFLIFDQKLGTKLIKTQMSQDWYICK